MIVTGKRKAAAAVPEAKAEGPAALPKEETDMKVRYHLPRLRGTGPTNCAIRLDDGAVFTYRDAALPGPAGISFAADRTQDRSEQEFCRLDTNKDRAISYEEFASCEFYRLEHVKKLPFVDLSTFPRDKSGNISEEDLKRYLFDRADKNKDRKIDRKEWEEFYNEVAAPR